MASTTSFTNLTFCLVSISDVMTGYSVNMETLQYELVIFQMFATVIDTLMFDTVSYSQEQLTLSYIRRRGGRTSRSNVPFFDFQFYLQSPSIVLFFKFKNFPQTHLRAATFAIPAARGEVRCADTMREG